DDADALADLRTAAPREPLVQQVLVDALALGAAELLRPGHAEPAPLAHRPHEGAPLRRVDDLRHVLAGEVEDVGVVVLVEEALDLVGEGLLLGGEVEVHTAADVTGGSRRHARPGGSGLPSFAVGKVARVGAGLLVFVVLVAACGGHDHPLTKREYVKRADAI